jgi:hypothetical protein
MYKHQTFLATAITALLALTLPAFSSANDSSASLAQELTNPIADLITMPIQMNIDQDIGPADDGTKVTTNVQPVIPFDINEDWNLITRTIVPVIYQDDVFPDNGPEGFRFRLQANLVLAK